jgi:hypothetical protein
MYKKGFIKIIFEIKIITYCKSSIIRPVIRVAGTNKSEWIL